MSADDRTDADADDAAWRGDANPDPAAAELAREQRHVDRAYERLEVLRRRARDRSAEVLGQSRGGTHQARHERDALVRSTLHRLDQIDAAEYGLVFGRLDEDDGDRWHIGRLGISDDDYEALVVDWRAPIAEAFYRATPLHPMGVRRRRHVHMRRREVVRLDDELLDVDAARDGDVELVGEGALLAAVARPRGERMGDIVATIQREQDEVIRAPLDGITVVQGGPGTGKTAVALHRVAYLLYINRERIEHTGVLVIGPSARFLRYIGDVLPGLGEHAVRLSRITDLLGDDLVSRVEPPEVQQAKGDARMATVLQRLARRWPWSAVRDDEWDVLPATMLRVLLTDRDLLHRVAGDVLPVDRIDVLVGSAGAGWTAADVALLDVLVEIVDRRRPRRRARNADSLRIDETIEALGIDPGRRDEVRTMLARQTGDAAAREEVYGHVVIDEAQELSPMQWRMLTRRCPSGSMTVVGDIDQATGATALDEWAQLGRHLGRSLSAHELTVNYRTPTEVMAYVERFAEVTGVRRVPHSVRASGREPLEIAVAPDDVVGAVADAVATVDDEPGTVAVIVPPSLSATVAGAVGDDVAVLTPTDAKGLEFDAVVLVGPEQIVDEGGGAALYVALTRTTRDLIVVIPEGTA
jgi:DNA helicase IV